MKNINIMIYKIHRINFSFFLIQIFKKKKTNFNIYFKRKWLKNYCEYYSSMKSILETNS